MLRSVNCFPFEHKKRERAKDFIALMPLDDNLVAEESHSRSGKSFAGMKTAIRWELLERRHGPPEVRSLRSEIVFCHFVPLMQFNLKSISV
jgi:hypothetical protein